MVNYNKILLNVIFSACPLLLIAQDLIGTKEKEFGRFSEQTEISSNFIPSLVPLELNFSDPTIATSEGNNVFITQTGMNNNIDTKISSQDAIVELDQSGESNDVQLEIEADMVRGVVVQKGNNNEIFDYVLSSDEPVFFDFKQEGNNHHIESYGSNSISNGLKVELIGNSKAIIIKNFN